MPPVAALTGGTGGLGRYIARGLVQAGWHLVLVARDRARAESTAAWLGGAGIEIQPADLGLLADTRAAAAAIAARHPAIGLLMLNAGTFQARRRLTAEGHELTLAVNHLSPFVLIQALAPHLRAGQARVVVTGSDAADHARLTPERLDLPHRWTQLSAYPVSKLALLATSLEWSRRLAPHVSVNVVHPGLVATGLVRSGGPIGWVWRHLAAVALTAEQGAATPLRAALDPAMTGVTGRYLKPAGLASPNRRALDPAMVARIWQATQRLVTPPGHAP